jgi:hypothetical protein
MDVQELSKYLTGGQNVQVFHGIDGYVAPILLRLECKNKVVKQMINAEEVAKFHALTSEFIKKQISTRAQRGITIKNLIREDDTKFPIELSDKATLKETRVLPKDFEINSIIAIFDDYVTLTNLDTENCMGIIVKDALIAKTVESMYDNLWNSGREV